MFGYLGKILRLDLTQGKLWDEALNQEYARNFIGGSGMAARLQAWRYLYNSLVLCQFENPPARWLAELLHYATGWQLGVDDLIPLGIRIVNIKRMLNIKLGLTKADDRLPELLLKPLKEGGAAGYLPGMPTLLRGAYAEFGWDPQTGAPPGDIFDSFH